MYVYLLVYDDWIMVDGSDKKFLNAVQVSAARCYKSNSEHNAIREKLLGEYVGLPPEKEVVTDAVLHREMTKYLSEAAASTNKK